MARFTEDFLRVYQSQKGNTFTKVINCWRTPGVHAIAVYRLGHWLKNKSLLLKIFLGPLYLAFDHRIRTRWGIAIDRHAEIGPGCYIGHYGGITISGRTKIGRNANISQQVTIGVSGQGEKEGAPRIDNDVYIAPGAKIFGKIHIGSNVKIGANAVVYKDIPDNAIVVLDPGFRIISFKGNQGAEKQTLSKA